MRGTEEVVLSMNYLHTVRKYYWTTETEIIKDGSCTFENKIIETKKRTKEEGGFTRNLC